MRVEIRKNSKKGPSNILVVRDGRKTLRPTDDNLADVAIFLGVVMFDCDDCAIIANVVTTSGIVMSYHYEVCADHLNCDKKIPIAA